MYLTRSRYPCSSRNPTVRLFLTDVSVSISDVAGIFAKRLDLKRLRTSNKLPAHLNLGANPVSFIIFHHHSASFFSTRLQHDRKWQHLAFYRVGSRGRQNTTKNYWTSTCCHTKRNRQSWPLESGSKPCLVWSVGKMWISKYIRNPAKTFLTRVFCSVCL